MRALRLRVFDVSTSDRIVKRRHVGRALRSCRLGYSPPPKRVALPVFASDALCSVYYVSDQTSLTLAVADGSSLVVERVKSVSGRAPATLSWSTSGSMS